MCAYIYICVLLLEFHNSQYRSIISIYGPSRFGTEPKVLLAAPETSLLHSLRILMLATHLKSGLSERHNTGHFRV